MKKLSLRRFIFLLDQVRKSSDPFVAGLEDGRIILHNRAYEILTGYSSRELQRISWKHDLTPIKWLPLQEEKIKLLHMRNMPQTFLKEYRRKDKTLIKIEVVLHKIGIYLIAFIRPVQEEPPCSISSPVAKVQGVLDLPRLPILILTDQETVHGANSEAKEFLGVCETAFSSGFSFRNIAKPLRAGGFPSAGGSAAETEYRFYLIECRRGKTEQCLCLFVPLSNPLAANQSAVILCPLADIVFGSRGGEILPGMDFRITDREKTVLLLVLEGHLYKEIAEKLSISLPTVRTHIQHIYKKLRVSSRDQLFRRLKDSGLTLTHPSGFLSSFFRDSVP